MEAREERIDAAAGAFRVAALETALRGAGLGDLDACWSRPEIYVELPNRRRGGWSAVSCLTLADEAASVVFLKRQVGHRIRCWRHPLRGEPTVARELAMLRRCARAGVDAAEPLAAYWAGPRAVLVTRRVAGMPLDEAWPTDDVARRDVIVMLAAVVRRLHRAGIRHNALYPKHIFVAGDRIALIDMETSRPVRDWRAAARRDLDTLNRRSRFASLADRARFLRAYIGGDSRADRRAWWRRLARQAR